MSGLAVPVNVVVQMKNFIPETLELLARPEKMTNCIISWLITVMRDGERDSALFGPGKMQLMDDFKLSYVKQ